MKILKGPDRATLHEGSGGSIELVLEFPIWRVYGSLNEYLASANCGKSLSEFRAGDSLNLEFFGVEIKLEFESEDIDLIHRKSNLIN